MAKADVLFSHGKPGANERYFIVKVSFGNYNFDQNIVLQGPNTDSLLLIYADEYERDFMKGLQNV